MNTIQELKDRRDTLTLEMESIQRDLMPLEEALESPEIIQQGRQRAAQDEINDHKRRIDSRDHEIYLLNQKIDRLEALANRESLAAGYLSGIANWKADEMELNEKRSSIETRLQQVRQSDQEDMAKARQAERTQRPLMRRLSPGATWRARRPLTRKLKRQQKTSRLRLSITVANN